MFQVGKKGQPQHYTTYFYSTTFFQAHNQKAKLHSTQQGHSAQFILQNKSSGIAFKEKKCLLGHLKTINSFQQFLSPAAIATVLIVSNKQNASAGFLVGVSRTVKFMCMLLISYTSPSSFFSNGFPSISFCLLVMRCNSGL